MIALDSDAFSLALKGVANRHFKTRSNIDEEQRRANRGQAFVAKQLDDGEPIMISTVSLSEYLVLFPADKQAEQLTEIQKTFRVCPFDDRAALVAARIRQSTMKSKEISEAYVGRKRLLKVDSLVLAVAVANGADKLVSYDKGMQALARAAYPSRHLVMEFPAVEELQFEPPKPPEESGDAC